MSDVRFIRGLCAIMGAAYVGAAVGYFSAWWITTPSTCSTDAECAATRQCILTPGCDGGPDPAHQPYAWLP